MARKPWPGSQAEASIVTILCVLPYFFCKMAIAANTAFIEYFYGQIKDPTGTALASEADTLHWEFLWMGTAMGGMRAVSILGARQFRQLIKQQSSDMLLQASSSDDQTTEIETNNKPFWQPHEQWSFRRVVAFLFRGYMIDMKLNQLEGEEALAVGDVVNLALGLTTVYSILVAAIFYHSASIFFIAPHTNQGLLQQIQDYGRGFAWAVLPIQHLYLYGQFALGLGAGGIPLIYDGIINSVVGTLCAWQWYPHYGAYGLGLSMAAGAWVAWILNVLHFAVDPYWQRLGLAFTPFNSLFARAHRLTRVFGANGIGRYYVRFAAPLAISNMLGLAQSLIVAALVSETKDNEAIAYSISSSYFQTMSIAMLGASSVVSAVLSARAPLSPGVLPATRRLYFMLVAVVVLALALAFGLLPILAPERFAVLFGGKVYAFSPAKAKQLLPRVKSFNILNVISFVISALGMVVAAALHGWSSMWPPTIVYMIGSTIGGTWAYGFKHRSVMDVAWGNIVTSLVQLLLLLALLFWHRRRYFTADL